MFKTSLIAKPSCRPSVLGEGPGDGDAFVLDCSLTFGGND